MTFPDVDCVTNLPGCVTQKGGLITSSVASGAGTFTWSSIPDLMTNEGVVRISKAGDLGTYDDTDVFFYIKGSVSNVQGSKKTPRRTPPATPIDLPISVDKWITWNYTGDLGTVNIYYATDGNLGSPTWTIIADQDGAGPHPAAPGFRQACRRQRVLSVEHPQRALAQRQGQGGERDERRLADRERNIPEI